MSGKGGVREAARMLAGLELADRERILTQIAQSNPQMAEMLRQNMVTFEDLRLMTVNMLTEFLREIDIQDLALALRLGSAELKKYFLENVSKGIKEDILLVLDGKPQPKSKVLEATEKIMQVVREKVDKGELILKEDDGEEYV